MTKNYVAGIEYAGANLEAIYHAEGRCTPNGSNFYYEYTLKDHLGNARVHWRANGTAVTFLEELHYYPFGMLMEGIGTAAVTVNAYKYNSKELNTDLGLNWSDYGARWYDASVGRWWSVDPLAEKYVGWGIYNYVLGNPVRMIDPDGRYAYPEDADYSQYTQLTRFLQNDIQSFLNDETIRNGLKTMGGFTDDQIDELSRFGHGTVIIIEEMPQDNGEKNGETPSKFQNNFKLDKGLVEQLQNAKTPEDIQSAQLAVLSTILHETTHVGFNLNSGVTNRATFGDFERKEDQNGDIQYLYKNASVGNSRETGKAFENAIWFEGAGLTRLDLDTFRKHFDKGGANDMQIIINNSIKQGMEGTVPKIKKK